MMAGCLTESNVQVRHGVHRWNAYTVPMSTVDTVQASATGSLYSVYRETLRDSETGSTMIRSDYIREYNQLVTRATYGRLTSTERARFSLIAGKLGFPSDLPSPERKQSRKGETTAYVTFRQSGEEVKATRRTLW